VNDVGGTTSITEIDITGANCPTCLRETLDRLRAEPGVRGAQATITGGCLRVVHDGLAVDDLLEVVRRHLHAVDASMVEATMVEVDARVAGFHCSHHQR
jgi:hypothetical protein